MEITYQVICIILSKVMEDGEVIDSTSAMTTHKAVTSIHIDMNRMSQVYGNVTPGSFDDLGIQKKSYQDLIL